MSAVATTRMDSEILKFYSGTNVFITGGTGFMGKILIEKLLRSTEVATIYLLVREKKGKDMITRTDELFEDIIFQRLRNESCGFKHRIVGVAGDCSIAGLGLSLSDRQMLISNVNIVFHVAATVRFDEHLKLAYAINVNGTRDCLELCKQIKQLKSFVHVSTAYSNCIFEKIEEKFYDYPVRYDDVAMLLTKISDREIAELTPKILGKWPNTYAFTKALAEALIRENGNGIPIGVFRPAIVISTYKEPIEGWINNLYGPTGVVAGVASGVLRTLHCDKDVIANIVPVDTCVAGLIASAWDVANKDCERIWQNIPIYNYVSSMENPITWGEYHTVNLSYGFKYPLSKSIWTLTFRTTPNETMNNVYKLFYHYLPAVAMDCIALLCGQKPRLLKMYKKIHKFSGVIAYFCTRDWTFTNTNVVNLYEKMNETDKELFPLSITKLLWFTYFKTYFKGLREHLLKDPMKTIDVAKKRQQKFVIAHRVLKYVMCVASAQVVYTQISRLISFVSNREIGF